MCMCVCVCVRPCLYDDVLCVVVNSLFAFIAIISLVAFVLLICQFTFTLFLLHKRRKRIPLQNLSYSAYPLVSHFPSQFSSLAFFSRAPFAAYCIALKFCAKLNSKCCYEMAVGSRSLEAITIRSNCYSLRYSAALPAISLFTCNLSATSGDESRRATRGDKWWPQDAA